LIHLGSWWIGGTEMTNVRHDSDDRHPRGRLGPRGADAPADGVPIAPHLTRKRLVDQHHRRLPGSVRVAKIPGSLKPHSPRREVAGRHHLIAHARFLTLRGPRLSVNDNRDAERVTADRERDGGSHGSHTWKSRDLLQQVAVEPHLTA